ncbi:MAG: 6-carboxytetrahydropterin synthase [Phycisphaerales bacterium]|nr:6-carboxytetrahydropterin synthase [Phycisphaerales bacterium]
MGAYFEVDLEVVGPLDDHTGMAADIRTLDRLIRTRFAPLAAQALSNSTPPGSALRTFLDTLDANDPNIATIRWRLNPRLSIMMDSTTMDTVLISNKYQFAASHRLFIPELSDEENTAIFGKCCWINGHGHNYHVEVDVATPIDGAFDRHQLDAIVESTIVERFDHKYLNLDCPEFKDRTPTVEHITIVCHDLLAPELAAAGGELHQVRVWETQKTWSAYPVRSNA